MQTCLLLRINQICLFMLTMPFGVIICLLPYSYSESVDKSLLYIRVVLNLLRTFHDTETCALPGYYAAKIVIATIRCVITRKNAVIIYFAAWNHEFLWNCFHVNSYIWKLYLLFGHILLMFVSSTHRKSAQCRRLKSRHSVYVAYLQ